MQYRSNKSAGLNGSVIVPGDKSISHRSIMLGALATGVTEISGFLEGEDSLATLAAFRAMGVKIDGPDNGSVTVHGVGLHGLSAPSKALDIGNSGTSIRLMAGVLAGQNFPTELYGDASLAKRPMNRVVLPLREMGADIDAAEGGRPPLKISASKGLSGIRYELPVASAQIKSCLLLAGLYATGETLVVEPAPTRDHTERMLRSLSCEVKTNGNEISVSGGQSLQAAPITVPADISSAAFFLVAASITPGSDLVLKNVGVNPTRTGILEVLKLMGGDITLQNERLFGAEPVADIRVRYAKLKGINIPERCVPLAIDEFPVLFIAASVAEGETLLSGARELRVKESDRIAVMAEGLAELGLNVDVLDDGMRIYPGPLHGGRVESHDDHRIAMAFAVAGLIASDEVIINNCANVATSFPGFVSIANECGFNIAQHA